MARDKEEEEVRRQRSGVPHYAVGSEVEVQMTEPGFHGAFYVALISKALPGSGGYEVIYSTLVEDGGGGPLREAVAAANVRPRPPQPLRCDLNVFDMVDAYHRDGWWSGVVSAVWPASTTAEEPRYAVSFPAVSKVEEIPASLVRPRRAFVRGCWIDAKEVVPRVPLYDVGKNVEVMWHEGSGWMTATIIKMLSSTSYVVQHGNREGSFEVVHPHHIRPQPTFDRMKSGNVWEPSAEVEVYQDGIWFPGVISDVESSEYGVTIQRHNSTEEEDYISVRSSVLRPRCKWDGQEEMHCSAKKHARRRKYAVSVESSLSPVSSTPGGDSDQNSSVPHMRLLLPPGQVITDSFSARDIYTEAPSDKEEKVTSALPKLEKCQNYLMKTHARRRVSNNSSCFDVIEISDTENSGYGDVIVISDNSSYNPSKRKKRRPNPQEEGLHSRLIVQPKEESSSTSKFSLSQYPPSDQNLLAAVKAHPGIQQCSHLLPLSVALREPSQDSSTADGAQLNSQPGPGLGMQPLHGLPGMNETKEQPLSGHLHSEPEFMTPDASASRYANHEMSQQVTEFKSCNEEADTSLMTFQNSKQSIVDRSHGEANSMRQWSRDSDVPFSMKIEPSSSAEQGVEADLSCMQGHTKKEMEKITGISPREEAHCKLEIPMKSAAKVVEISCHEVSPSEEELNSNHMLRPCQDSVSTSNLSLAQNPPSDHDLLLDITRDPDVQPCNYELSPSVSLLESSQAPSNIEGAQLIPLSSCLVLGLPGMSETKEPPMLGHVHYEVELTAAPDHSTDGDENHEMSQEVTVDTSWMAKNCNEGADTNLMASENHVSHPEVGPSLQRPGIIVESSVFMPAPSSSTLPSELVASSLELKPDAKVEVFTRLPQRPHFLGQQNCRPEIREVAESIKNMRIQDDDKKFQDKMDSLRARGEWVRSGRPDHPSR